MLNLFSNVKNFNDFAFFVQFQRQIKFKKKSTLNNKFKKLLCLFNVHTKLHLTNMTREFKIIINFNVFVNEIKYM